MSHTRPRASLLSLFDPLATTSPPREANSPSLDSDKENENPPTNDPLSAFFNQSHKANYPPPKPLTSRLIDVGDVTDPLWPEDDDDDDDDTADPSQWNDLEDDENDTLTFKQMAAAASPKWEGPTSPVSSNFYPITSPTVGVPRTPLRELTVDSEATPTFRGKILNWKTPKVPSKLSYSEIPEANSPVQIVITQPETLERDLEQSPTTTETQPSCTLSPAPPVNLASSSSSSISFSALALANDSILETPHPALISYGDASETSPDTSTSSFILPQLRPLTSREHTTDNHRNSMDLSTSFQMHMAESTFDLLHDKISFFGSKTGMESSCHDFEESFDLGLTKSKLDDFASPTVPDQSTTTQGKTEIIVDAAPSDTEDSVDIQDQEVKVDASHCTDSEKDSLETSSETSFADSDTTEVAKKLDSSVLTSRSNSPELESHCKVPLPAVPVILEEENVPPPATLTPRTVRPLSMPVPIAGLKIVKRSKAILESETNSRRSIAPGDGLKRLMPPSTRRASISTSLTQAVPSKPQPCRTTRESISRTDPTRKGPAPAATRRTVAPESGPRRVLLTETDAKPMPTASRVVPGTRVPSSGLIGPRRVPVAGGTSGSGSVATSKITPSLAPSSRQVSATTTASGLPKPTSRVPSSSIGRAGGSRLPAPSAIVRPTTTTATKEGSRGFGIRRVV